MNRLSNKKPVGVLDRKSALVKSVKADNCSRCKYFILSPGVKNYDGECHYGPPQLLNNNIGGWPVVRGTSWCGKFEGIR